MQFKKILGSICWLLCSFVATAQDSTHVQWNISSKKIADHTYQLTATGTVQSGWFVYTENKEVDGLTAPSFVLADSSIQLQGITQLTATNTRKEADPVFEGKLVTMGTGTVSLQQTCKFAEGAVIPASLRVSIQFNAGNKQDFLPEEAVAAVTLQGGVDVAAANRILIPTIDLQHPVNSCGGVAAGETSNSKGLLSIFLLGFAGGLVALLTPCVFPMIPLTVSFFTKKATSRKKGIANASLYGFFIFLIYIALSTPFHFISSLKPEILNNVSTNVYLNVFFFAVFIFFAGSFFGYYELTLPASLSSTSDSKAGVGNLAGIFFMALTLALVSFSCTGPILGSLLAGSLTNDGGATQLTMGMGGFGLALALPFALFALFPNWLNSLPKSGGWLNTVKVVLGFIEVAMAFKFLSNADLVMHWGILKREIFFGIWIIVGTGLTLYLCGLIKFPHDSPIKKLSTGRKILAMVFGIITLYLVPGVTNTSYANLKLISGFPPPLYYSIYAKTSDCPLGLTCSKDYETGLAMAKAANKPILLDFTGYACVNCRRMEEKVWSRPEVFKVMSEQYIVISLYVDDKKKLPAAFTYTGKDGSKKEIVTVGDKWATFETENFKNNAQPYYAIISPDEKLLTNPVGYTPEATEYLAWLKCGLAAYGKK